MMHSNPQMEYANLLKMLQSKENLRNNFVSELRIIYYEFLQNIISNRQGSITAENSKKGEINIDSNLLKKGRFLYEKLTKDANMKNKDLIKELKTVTITYINMCLQNYNTSQDEKKKLNNIKDSISKNNMSENVNSNKNSFYHISILKGYAEKFISKLEARTNIRKNMRLNLNNLKAFDNEQLFKQYTKFIILKVKENMQNNDKYNNTNGNNKLHQNGSQHTKNDNPFKKFMNIIQERYFNLLDGLFCYKISQDSVDVTNV